METNDSAIVTGMSLAIEVPEKILNMIKGAWIAALVSAGITFVITLLAIFGTPLLGFSGWELIDVAFVLGMAFGIYKKSRTCAVLMFIYFIISKVLLTISTGAILGLPIALAFLFLYWQGVAGTFAYHKLKKEHLVAPPVM